jgi:glyoxylase-like metal-dependent hydrolase (beta-lactamase superfamily II)
MREISPGLWHWSAPHDRIGVEVSSYYLERERVVLDPMIPEEGLEWFERHGSPEHILMTNRHHDRHAWQLHEAFGSKVHCVRNGVHELKGRGPVEVFDFGDQLPVGITAYEIGAICPDETALHIPAHAALACADGVVHYGEKLGFVPEQFIDDPELTKRALREAYARLLDRDLDFDVLLLAHGEPLVGGAKDALRAFVAGDS